MSKARAMIDSGSLVFEQKILSLLLLTLANSPLPSIMNLSCNSNSRFRIIDFLTNRNNIFSYHITLLTNILFKHMIF